MSAAKHRMSPRKNVRYSVIKSVKGGMSVLAASKKYDLHRSTIYGWLKRIECKPADQWEEALRDRPRGWHKHAQQTTDQQRLAIQKIARAHPSWGSNRISDELAKQGVERSHHTVQKQLNAMGLGTSAARAKSLDVIVISHSDEQLEIVEKFNPNVRDRTFRGNRPGETMFIDALPIASAPGAGNLVLYVAIDRCSAYATAVIGRANAEGAVGFLRQALQNVRQEIRTIKALVVPKNRIFGAPFVQAAKKHDIEVKTLRKPRSGFVDRFHAAFERDSSGDKGRLSLADQSRLLRWIRRYNQQSLDGFPNFGASPMRQLRDRERKRNGIAKKN